MLQQYRKPQETKTKALAVAVQMALERDRALELEQLVTLGRNLANALDYGRERRKSGR